MTLRSDVFVYLQDMHGAAHEMVIPCVDGYTVYLDISLTQEQREEAYLHVLKHIDAGHWDFGDRFVGEMENEAHA